MVRNARILLPDDGEVPTLKVYIRRGGMKALEKARRVQPRDVIDEIAKSGLRGRGGAGFPTGKKWAGIADNECPTKYLACNAAEGEPGTFKDRFLIRKNPYQLIEGIAIAAYAVGVKKAFIAIKRSFVDEVRRLRMALKECVNAGYVGRRSIKIVLGPDDYLFGEEKALLQVIEGGDALPREVHYPPYVKGLFATPRSLNPTVVNNVETFSNVPHIVLRGASWFRTFGTADTPGTMVFTVSGDVRKPGVYELPMGTPLRTLINRFAGGPKNGREVKAVFSGVSNAVIKPAALDTLMDFGSMKAAGTGLGSGGFMVYSETACMLKLARIFSQFLSTESCAQCSACKVGCTAATLHLERLEYGRGDKTDVDSAIISARHAPQGNRCYLPVEESLLIPSILRGFRKEISMHYRRGCVSCREHQLLKFTGFNEESNTFIIAHQ